MKSALGVGDGAVPPPPPPPAEAPAGEPALPPHATPASPPTPAPSRADVRSPAEPPAAPPAQALVVPVGQPQKPAAPAPKARRRPVAPPESFDPGDLICGSCGIGNKPTRNYCRRCGTGLAAAEVASVPWWRRLWPKRTRRVKEAGSRPKVTAVRRFPTKLVALFGVLAVLGVGTYVLRDPVLTVSISSGTGSRESNASSPRR